MIGVVVILLLVPFATWLVRRRPGPLHRGWLILLGVPLLAADAGETSQPDPGEPLPLPNATSRLPHAAIPERHTIEFGVGGGQFPSCAGVNHYADAGALYRYSKPISRETNLTVTGGAYGAVVGLLGNSKLHPSGGVRGSVGLDHHWVGGSVGLMAGALRREASGTNVPILPTATLRLGPRDSFFIDGNLFDVSPAPMPGPILEVAAGIAFPRLGNRWEPFRVRAGMSADGVFVSPTIPIADLGNLDVTAAYAGETNWGASARMRVHFAGKGK